jgi:hypothetical protein
LDDRFAIQKVNDDPTLLPSTDLVPFIYDSRFQEEGLYYNLVFANIGFQGGLLGALEIARHNACGIVGEGNSGVSKVAAIVANVYKLPQISYSSTAASLSNKCK